MLSINSKTDNPRLARSLRTNLAIAFFTLGAIILLVNGILAAITNYLSLKDVISVRQLLIAQNAAGTVSNFIDDKFHILETAVVFTSPFSSNSEVQKTIVESFLGRDPAFRQIALLDNRGQQTSQISRTSQSLSPQFIDQLKRIPESQATKASRYISQTYIDDKTSEPLIAIAIPVNTVLGDFQGTLVAEVNLKFMWDLVDQLKVGKTGYVYVVDNQGKLIAFGDTARVLANENVSQISEVKEFIGNPSIQADTTPNVGSYQGLLGENVEGTFVPLGSPNWAVVTELPTAEAFIPFYQLLGNYATSSLVMAILAGLAGIFIARRVSAPLIELSNVATAIGAGNLALQAKVTGPAEIAQVASTFNTMASRLGDLIGTLEERVTIRTAEFQKANEINARRAQQFEAVSQVSRAINQTQGLQDLLPQITQVISKQFSFYHVGVFLLDANNEYAVLAASNSDGGQKMLLRNHKLKVGQVGIVGNVAKTGVPRIALDTGADAIYFNNPDLPETRSEMALPLFLSGQQLTGVVDIQSTEQNAFGPEDIQVLSTLADQVSIAIVNARLFEQTQKALLESEMVYRRDIQTGWAKFTRSLKLIGIHKVGLTSNLISEPMEIPGADEVFQSGNPYQKNSDNTNGSRQITIPMKLRGEIVGMLNVKTDNDRAWSADELDIISAIVERAALSIENARLLNESQKRAIHEQTISQMSTRIGAGTDIATILKTAVRELGTQIGGAQISVEIENE